MRRRKWLALSFIGLTLSVVSHGCTSGSKSDVNAKPSAEKMAKKVTPVLVDLRGPIAGKGRIVREETLFQMSDMTLTTSVAGQEIKGKISMVGSGLDETEILASDGNGSTRVRVRILSEVVETTTVMAGQSESESERDPLSGQTIIGEKVAGKWSFTMEEGKPSADQLIALRAYAAGYDEDRSLYPLEKTSIGQSWTIPENYFVRVFGTDDIDLSSASGEATLKDIVDYKGRRHALIAMTLKFEGREKESDLNVTFSVRGQYYRDLTQHVDVDADLKGNATYSGIVTQQGMKIQMQMAGPVTMSYSQRVLQ